MDSTQATSLGGSIVLDNVAFSGISTANVQDPSGTVLAANVSPVRQWFQGNTYSGLSHAFVDHHRTLNYPTTGTGVRTYERGTFASPPKKSTALLDSTGKFFAKSRPQYNTYTSSREASPNLWPLYACLMNCFQNSYPSSPVERFVRPYELCPASSIRLARQWRPRRLGYDKLLPACGTSFLLCLLSELNVAKNAGCGIICQITCQLWSR
jgi:hypothetical protein